MKKILTALVMSALAAVALSPAVTLANYDRDNDRDWDKNRYRGAYERNNHDWDKNRYRGVRYDRDCDRDWNNRYRGVRWNRDCDRDCDNNWNCDRYRGANYRWDSDCYWNWNRCYRGSNYRNCYWDNNNECDEVNVDVNVDVD